MSKVLALYQTLLQLYLLNKFRFITDYKSILICNTILKPFVFYTFTICTLLQVIESNKYWNVVLKAVQELILRKFIL